MADGTSDADYRIRFVTSSDLTGANATVASVREVGEATQSQLTIAREATAANAQAAIAIREAAAATAQTAVIAREYGVSLETAARAAALLAQSNTPLVAGSAELEAALESVQAAQARAAESTRAYNAELASSAAATIAAAAEEDAEIEISTSLAAALTRLGITQAEVAATATRMGLSVEIAGRAMVQLRQTAMAEEVAAAAVAMQALEGSTLDAAAAQTELAAQTEVAQASTMKFGRGSPAFHAMVAASNVTQGGTRAMRGWMEAAELAGVAFGGVVGPIILVSAVVGELIARYEEHNGKLREAKSEVDEYAQAWNLAKAQLTGYKTELDEILALQKQQMEMDDRLLANARERAGLLKEDAKQDQEKSLQGLRNQYLQDEARPQSDADRKELKDRYDASRQDIEQGGLVNTSILEASEAQQQLELTQKKLDDEKRAHNADILTAAEAFKNAEEARQRLEPYGIFLGKNKKAGSDGKVGEELSYVDPATGKDTSPIREIKGQIADAEKAYALEKNLGPARRDSATGVPIDDHDKLAEMDASLVAMRKRRDQLEADQAALLKESETNKTIGSKLPEQSDAISKLQDQVADLQAQLGQKQTGVGLAVTNKEQDDKQAALDKTARDQQVLRDAQKNESEAKIASLQAQLDAAQGAAKIPIQNQLTAAQQQAIRDEANFQSGRPIALPAAPETPSQKQHAEAEQTVAGLDQRIKQLEQQQRDNPDVADLIEKQIHLAIAQRVKASAEVEAHWSAAAAPTPQEVLGQSVRDKANADIARTGAAGQQADSRDQSQSQRTQAEEARRVNEGQKQDDRQLGREAETDIKSLGPTRQQAELARGAVQQLDQGHAEGAAQLGEILIQLVTSTKTLTTSQMQLFANVIGKLSKVDAILSSHAAALDQLQRGQKSSLNN